MRNLNDQYDDIDYDHVIDNITKIISLQNAPDSFCLDSNLTKSCQMSNFKQQMTKCVNAELQNLTKNTLDQKSSNLCVPISVTALLRFAMKNDLAYDDKFNQYTFYDSLDEYCNNSIDQSLVSDNLLIRCLAMLDQRFGKRRLGSFDLSKESEKVVEFFRIRCECEGLEFKKSEK